MVRSNVHLHGTHAYNLFLMALLHFTVSLQSWLKGVRNRDVFLISCPGELWLECKRKNEFGNFTTLTRCAAVQNTVFYATEWMLKNRQFKRVVADKDLEIQMLFPRHLLLKITVILQMFSDSFTNVFLVVDLLTGMQQHTTFDDDYGR